MGENNNELGYKNHDPFFYNLNKNFQNLLSYVMSASKDIRYLEDMYISMNSFYLFYYPYMKANSEDIRKELDEIKNFIYSKEYQYLLKDKKSSKETYKEATDCVLSVNELIPLMMTELYNNSLFPKMSKQDNITPAVARRYK